VFGDQGEMNPADIQVFGEQDISEFATDYRTGFPEHCAAAFGQDYECLEWNFILDIDIIGGP
jgi:hypothetical protein